MPLYLKYQGFNYVDPYNGAYAAADSLPQVAKTGASSVALTPDFGIDVANSAVYATGDGTDTLANLSTAIEGAAANGMTAFVRPLIDFFYSQASTTLPGTYYIGNYDDVRNVPSGVTPAQVPAGAPTISYRGQLQLGDLDLSKFGASYTAMILAEAKQAQAAGARLFSIGTELDTLATSTDPNVKSAWSDLIAQVRAVYSGKLTYCANWANAGDVSFWDKLDVVSIDGYVPLSNVVPTSASRNPSVADLVKGWTLPSDVAVDGTTVGALFGGLSAVDFYNKLAQRSIDKELVFSELGYPNDTGAARDPAGNAETGIADPSLQSRLYSAFFEAWGQAQQTAAANGGLVGGVPYALTGAYLWNWYPDAKTPSRDKFALDSAQAIGAIKSGFAPPSTVSIKTFLQSSDAIAAMRGGFQIADRAVAISAHLDALRSTAVAGLLNRITLTDGGTPTISITYAQAEADASVLKKIVGRYVLSVEPSMLTNDSTPTLTGTVDAGATVSLYDGTKFVGSSSADSSGAYAITTSALSDGTHRLSIKVTDSSGAGGVVGASRTVVVDTKAPPVPAVTTLTSASDTGRSNRDGVTSDATPTVAGKAEAGATVTLYDTDGVTILGSATATASGAYTIISAELSDGSHLLRIRATDRAGNTSALSAGRAIVVDTMAPSTPAAPVIAAASDTGVSASDGITRDTTPTLTGTAEAGASIALYDGAKRVGSALAGANGAYVVTSVALAEGTHNLSITAVDAAGNVSLPSQVTTIVIDTKAPVQPAAPNLAAGSDTGASSHDGVTQSSMPTLTGAAEPGAKVTLYDGTKLVGVATADGSTGAYSITSTQQADGVHRLTIKAADAAGNISRASAVRTIVVDTKAPIPTITGKGGTVTVPTQTISGRGEAGSTVTLSDNGAPIGGAIAVGANGQWSEKVTFSGSGAHRLVATDTDKAGNAGTSSPVVYQNAAAGMASLHKLIQAMSVTMVAPSAEVTPTGQTTPQDHVLAAAH